MSVFLFDENFCSPSLGGTLILRNRKMLLDLVNMMGGQSIRSVIRKFPSWQPPVLERI